MPSWRSKNGRAITGASEISAGCCRGKESRREREREKRESSKRVEEDEANGSTAGNEVIRTRRTQEAKTIRYVTTVYATLDTYEKSEARERRRKSCEGGCS